MTAIRPEQLYQTDFYAWTQVQAKELRRFARTRPNVPLDLTHLAEEIEDLGKSERSAVFSLVRLIMQHFLLSAHSSASAQRGHWLDEIDEFRSQIEDKLTPAIRRKMRRYGEEAPAAGLPEQRPFTLDQILGDWEPDTDSETS
jgi:hypothetical protein